MKPHRNAAGPLEVYQEKKRHMQDVKRGRGHLRSQSKSTSPKSRPSQYHADQENQDVAKKRKVERKDAPKNRGGRRIRRGEKDE
jgi:hypothetical protein